jgi:hypothetical protein
LPFLAAGKTRTTAPYREELVLAIGEYIDSATRVASLKASDILEKVKRPDAPLIIGIFLDADH